jgi:ribose 5-phosphate isomerase B
VKIVIGSDHGGFELKETIKDSLLQRDYSIIDVGCSSVDSVDYPDFADKVVSHIVDGTCSQGILICGTGIGMSIAANRDRRIRAANVHNLFTARMSREHNNANILCLGARVLETDLALEIVSVWLDTEFSGGRHQTRIAKFSE